MAVARRAWTEAGSCEPTVFTDVRPDATIAQEEIFGPVVAVIPYQDEDEAIAIANNSHYGLNGSVFTSDVERGLRVAARIQTGTVELNGNPAGFRAPMGGVKHSGLGREFGPEGLDAFVETEVHRPRQGSSRRPPMSRPRRRGARCGNQQRTWHTTLPTWPSGRHTPTCRTHAVDAAKKTILDTLGVSLAASGLEASIGSVLDYATRDGRSPRGISDRLGREAAGCRGGLRQRGDGSLSRLRRLHLLGSPRGELASSPLRSRSRNEQAGSPGRR